jgi:hypothetical protein
VRLTPSLRLQSGQPFGRIIVARLNYGTQTILTEPISAERQDHVTVLDLRAEKVFRFGGKNLSGFMDLYNITNTNTAVNITWTSGSSYLLPSVIVAPRIVRFGMKFDW